MKIREDEKDREDGSGIDSNWPCSFASTVHWERVCCVVLRGVGALD